MSATALEVYMLELINAERAAAGVQPLAFNDRLRASSEAHSEWMLATGTFSHDGEGGSDAGDRIVAAGYELTGNWAWGENLAWISKRAPVGLEDEIAQSHTNLMNSPGHRANILEASFREIGIASVEGVFDGYDSLMTTQNFGRSGTELFITGVAYADDGNTRYDYGEGYGGIRVEALSNGQVVASDVTGVGGDFALELPAGTYTVTFDGRMAREITVTSVNVKTDLILSGEGRMPVQEVRGTAGDDVVRGSDADEDLFGLAGDDVVYGYGGFDILYGGDGWDDLYGGSGDDILIGGLGDDYMDGGAGFDAVDIGDFREAVTFGAYVGGDGRTVYTVESVEGYDAGVDIETLLLFDGAQHGASYSHIMQVARLYEVALGRDAEAYGLNSWTDALDGGAELVALANAFLGSDEFLNRYGSLGNNEFIAQLYRNALNREPDRDGLDYWNGRLNAGESRAQVLVGFSESPEYIEISMGNMPTFGLFDPDETATAVGRIYRAALGRDPDADGLLYWINRVRDGTSLDTVADGFLSSNEFSQRYGNPSDSRYIDLLYENVLGRPPEQDGKDYWLGQLNSGADRGDVLNGFAQSPEFQASTAEDYRDGVDVVL